MSQYLNQARDHMIRACSGRNPGENSGRNPDKNSGRNPGRNSSENSGRYSSGNSKAPAIILLVIGLLMAWVVAK